MSIFDSAAGSRFRFPSRRMSGHDTLRQDELAAALQASLAREEAWRVEKRDLLRRQELLTQEFEHRLFNGLQMISSLLSLQSRAEMPETAAQLLVAAHRISALGRVHRRLHLLDHQKNVVFKQYLEQLCEELAGLLFQQGTDCSIVVSGTTDQIPTALGMPLGFIVSELITNAAKYADGDIRVRFVTTSPGVHALSVSDDGPGMPAGFDPARSKRLGMKIICSLVNQIGGELHILPGDNGRGARFTITFCSLESATV